MYGRYAHAHNEIHWTTISPSISTLFTEMQKKGNLKLKQKWTSDMPKASEKRFHRAYWLAANMLKLGGLLNSGILPERPHDALDDEEMDDEEFVFTVEELQTGEENERSEDIWNDIVEKMKGMDLDDLGSEHVVTGGKEME